MINLRFLYEPNQKPTFLLILTSRDRLLHNVNVMCGLAYFCKLRRISDESVKLPPQFSCQGLVVVDIWVSSQPWRKILISNKYDVAKGTTIGSAFFAKTGHSSLSDIQIDLTDFLSWTTFLGKYCITGKVNILFFFLFRKGRWCRLDKRISNPFTAW